MKSAAVFRPDFTLPSCSPLACPVDGGGGFSIQSSLSSGFWSFSFLSGLLGLVSFASMSLLRFFLSDLGFIGNPSSLSSTSKERTAFADFFFFVLRSKEIFVRCRSGAGQDQTLPDEETFLFSGSSKSSLSRLARLTNVGLKVERLTGSLDAAARDSLPPRAAISGST